jgi:hypothetical protein
VINLSLAAYPVSDCENAVDEMKETLENAAKKNWVVIAAGNDKGDAIESLPGCITGPNDGNLLTVASVNCNETCAVDYSNFGAPVDWVAVGTNVFSTSRKDASGNWTYRVVQGTSMSTAVISGVIHATGRKPKNGTKVTCGPPGGTARNYHLGVK